MNPNNTQHKSFLWHLDFEPFTWHTIYGEQCPSFVTEENKEAWQRYLKKVIKKHPLASRLRAIHLAHHLRRAMSVIRYRREQGGMATLSEKSHQEASEERGDEYT